VHSLLKKALLAAALLAAPASAADAQDPELSEERVVLHTVAGDIVLALYPEVAPAHVHQVLRLVGLGVYDTTHFVRIVPGFVLQLSPARLRTRPMTTEQRNAVYRLKAEFSHVLEHRRGVVSMARYDDDVDSGETSFSILLGDAPHLDGEYTIFGRVVHGMDVVDELARVPLGDGDEPVATLSVESAEVVPSAAALAELELAPALPLADLLAAGQLPAGVELKGHVGVQRVVENAYGVYLVAGGLAMVAVSLASFLLAGRLSRRSIAAFHLINVFIGGVVALGLLVPLSQGSSLLATAVFLGLLALFRLLGRFEGALSSRPAG